MTDTFNHGVRVLEVTAGARPLRTVASAIIGLVATAEDADDTVFPANTPVLITNLLAAIEDAGVEGTLARALQDIADQGNVATIVVRVPEGVNPAATATNVIGGSTNSVYTGIQALLTAETVTGFKPRILGAPGLDIQTVTAALATVAAKLHGFAYAGCGPSDTVTEAIAYRDNFSARELMLLYPDFTVGEVTSYAVARAMGLRAVIDQTQGWNKSLSNVAVNGVTGVTQPIHWDLQDQNTDAGLLNAAPVTTLIRKSGYRFWGNRTCSDDPAFAFEVATRTAQILRDTVAEGMLWALDKPLHPSLARDIVETINARFRSYKAAGLIIDATAWYDPGANAAEDLAAGKLTIDYDFTFTPPLEDLTLRQRITDRYMADFAARVLAGG